ncbi:MAG TPA: NYN domain-containing protein [Candidatus Aminicenantes bacterium]|nr:NYN domain-containing protein [Candidatus Aminicenantes bacterium]HRY64035.1 NYN domain-containing protein [Candidatus Aminicenantes bacterium]HRZ70948.1 NYN domain-containing protein [Candidatus Aminicenantes bacterium]
MAYLIDGNNLLGRIAPHELRERTGREGLVSRLLAFQRVTRTRIHLVFDGNPEATPTDIAVNPKFVIHYPGEGGSADDVIREMIAAQTDKRGFFVVSSDRAIRDQARKKGLTAVTSDVFARELKAALKEGRKRRELDKRTEAPTDLEIDLWDEVFRAKP